jgi:hypothetical protein
MPRTGSCLPIQPPLFLLSKELHYVGSDLGTEYLT